MSQDCQQQDRQRSGETDATRVDHSSYELVRRVKVDDIKSEARLYRHRKTGAQVLSMINGDENKVFGITFRTPPKDSTGVAHILEHSVLCGSRKYPVKEPFVELLKSSQKTFLNAFTYPDKTCYPVASQNLRDFYNLVDVYLDAVLFPRLTPEVLMQEGWHLEAESVDGPLTYQGVVYGEMKGVYSSPDSVLAEQSQQSLFPDTTYGLDSGGDPAQIPRLTFDAFKAFHDQYYHPSNARVFFWGDDDPHQRLCLLDEYFREFEAIDVDSSISLQSPFEAPRRIVKPYAVSEEAQGNRAMVSFNWMLGQVTDPELLMGLRVLSVVLLGTPASPLYKALIDSGLGEALVGGGLETELRQIVFSTGLKGIAEDAADRVEKVVFDVLDRLVKNSIDPLWVHASIHTLEFHLREANTGSYPRGLVYMLKSLRDWLYDRDPIDALAFEAPLASIKGRVAKGERYFEGLIEKYLLNNPHRTRVLLVPDKQEAKRREDDERERLVRLRSAMSDDEVGVMIAQAQELKRKQQTPDSQSDLATIPVLSVSDLPRENKVIPEQWESVGPEQVPVHFHCLDTFGIGYVDLAFDLSCVPYEDLVLLPLLGRALLETGTDKEDFVSLARRISANTGGIVALPYFAATRQTPSTCAKFLLRGKAMFDKAGELTGILSDIMHGARVDDGERIRQLLSEDKAMIEEGMIPSGHSVVDTRLRRTLSQAGWIHEQIDGIEYLGRLRDWVDNFDSRWPELRERLRRLQGLVFNRRAALVNLTCDRAGFATFAPHLEALLSGLDARETRPQTWTWSKESRNEGLTIPSQVQYVGKAANLFALGYEYHGSANVIARFLRTGWLWDRVRVQGGAYGAFCQLNRRTGAFSFLSYRDPNLEQTLDAYDGAAKHLQKLDISQHEIDKSILGTIGEMDAYMLPDAKGYVSFVRHLLGQSKQELDKLRAEVFATTLDDFRRFGDVLSKFNDAAHIAVLGGPDAIARVESTLHLHRVAVL